MSFVELQDCTSALAGVLVAVCALLAWGYVGLAVWLCLALLYIYMYNKHV